MAALLSLTFNDGTLLLVIFLAGGGSGGGCAILVGRGLGSGKLDGSNSLFSRSRPLDLDLVQLAIGFAGVIGYPPGALLDSPSVPLIYISIRVLFVGFSTGYIKLTTSRSICVCSIRLPAGRRVATVGTGRSGIMLQVH